MSASVHVTNTERFFKDSEIIVSKTNTQGRIVYGNKLFYDIADYDESDCLEQPHSLVRHPDMPRVIFQLLWDTIRDGKEIFAYVKNRAKNGDYYWVYAHVTPSYDVRGGLTGYHSTRRAPNRQILESAIIPLYRSLAEQEHKHGNRKEGLEASRTYLDGLLRSKGLDYDTFIHTL